MSAGDDGLPRTPPCARLDWQPGPRGRAVATVDERLGALERAHLLVNLAGAAVVGSWLARAHRTAPRSPGSWRGR
jgi:hypothetical protein